MKWIYNFAMIASIALSACVVPDDDPFSYLDDESQEPVAEA